MRSLQRRLWPVRCKCELLLLELGPETVKHFRKRFMVSGPSSTRSSSHLHHDLFACQNCYNPPSGFPLTLTWPVIFCFPTFMLCVFPMMQSRLEIVGLLLVPRAEPNTSPKACGALQTVPTANYWGNAPKRHARKLQSHK